MTLTLGGVVAHALCAIAFLGFALAHGRRAGGGAPAAWMRIACGLTALWAVSFVLAALGKPWAGTMLSPLETLRSAAWLGFLTVLLQQGGALDGRARAPLTSGAVLTVAVVVQLALDLVARGASGGAEAAAAQTFFLFARLAVAIGGLLLTHNLFINTAPASRWSIRLLCIAMAGLFGFDLNLYTVTLLTGTPSANLFNMRGVADALVVPLLWLSARRAPAWRLQLSRQVVFQTFSLAGIGGYLVVMAALGWGLRQLGGDWGRLLQTGLIFAMLLAAAVVLVSGRFRAWARVKINKHFFAYKFDYREEWLRFIATIAQTDAAAGPLRARVVQAVCQIVDSPAGAVFVADEDGGYVPVARWNPIDADERVAPHEPLVAYLAERGRIADLDEVREGRGDGAGLTLPPWAEDRRLWLAVPLVHLERMIGFVVLARSLAPRSLNWEDYDLLRTAGRQAASYIAEHALQTRVQEAAKFEEFNRRFAFIMHDIKNIASQIGLLARNAERHADNPDFRRDMIETLNASVKRMNGLLARLGERSSDRQRHVARVDLAALLRRVVAAKRGGHVALELDASTGPAIVVADAESLAQAFEHLAQNAIDASEPGAPVLLRLRTGDGAARVEVIDHGCGMSATFLRDELFEPFHSTKPGGFGIGAYEAREIVRRAGGRLSVQSREGEGTTFTAELPLAADAQITEAA